MLFPRDQNAFVSVLRSIVWLTVGTWGAASALAAPIINSFSPIGGPPGTSVTINGSGFSDAAKVEFGDQRIAAFVVVSATRIVAAVPDNGLTANIRVTSAGGSSGAASSAFWVAPRIDDFRPKRGSSTTTVTIEGANFISGAGNTVVYFGSIASPLVSVTADSQIQAKVPAGISNAVLYVATFVGAATSKVDFVSTTLPVIEDFTPTNGLPGKGISVVINGANLNLVTSLKFNGTASGVTHTADTQISTTIPAGATSGKITVSGSNGTGTSPMDFIVGPTIDIVPPGPFNPMAGKPGDFVVIYGNDFTGVTNVSFNGALAGSANVQLPANNQVKVKIPTGATTGPVKVLTTNGEAISPVNFTIGPLITSMNANNGQSTNSGPVGSQVTVFGAGFLQPGLAVKFGGVAAGAPIVNADNQLTVTVPNGATNAPVLVATTYGTNTTPYNFLVTTSIPLIDDFEPKVGPQGTQMQIRGAKFTGATQVTIGGVPVVNPQVTADTLILATVPAGVLTGPVRVSNASGTGVSAQTFQAPPWISSVNPQSGIVGNLIELTGTNFVGVQNVYFGPAPAALSSVTANGMFAQIPLAARSGPITLMTPGGSFVTSNRFTVLPKILDFQPRVGPIGTVVTITGTSFYDVTNVAFNGVSASVTNVISPQEIQATVPMGATTGMIRVATVDGETFSPIAFTVTTASDLSVTETVSTNVVVPGGNVTYTSTVANSGSSILSGITLTNTFSSGLDLQSAVASQGGCGITANVVACALGIITNGFSATVTITVNVPTDGVFTNLVRVQAIEGDTTSGNNTARDTIVAASLAQRTLSIDLLSSPQRAVVQWPVSQVPFRLRSIDTLGDTNVSWVTVSPLFQSLNGTNHFTNASPTGIRYYRLEYP